MKNSKGKYDKILSIFLIIIFIALIGTLGPFIYNELKTEIAIKKGLDNFEDTANHEDKNETRNEQINEDVDIAKGTLEDILNELNSEENIGADEETYSSTLHPNQAINYNPVGKIEIQKTNVNYPIYQDITKVTLEAGVAIAYGPGLNQTGNTVIYGHNFRNGKFFSNNKKLSKGDIIYITDLEGNKLAYRIYSIYITTPTDASYMIRDTEGRREISLQTCTDDNSQRLIIWASAD